MNALVYWAITAVVLILLAGLIGRRVKYLKDDGTEGSNNWLGILIDERRRFSLTHLQLVLWSLVLLSLLAAIFFTRLFGGDKPTDLLNITIPTEILTLAGISGGSAILATAAKSTRTGDVIDKQDQRIASLKVKVGAGAPAGAKPKPESPSVGSHFSQMFMVEDGEETDKVIDVAKFQNFFLTLIAVGAYVIMAASVLSTTTDLTKLGFPGFSADLLWLVGISHAGYIGNKLVPQTKK